MNEFSKSLNELKEKTEKAAAKCNHSIVCQFGGMFWHSVDGDTFDNDILPTETNNSKNIYIVSYETSVQIWKGNIRIPLSGEGETWTVGVINMNNLST